MLHRFIFTLISFLLFSFATATVQAADPRAWVGGSFGLTVPNEDNTSARSIYGLTLGAKVGSEIGVGAYYFSSAKDEDFGRFDYDLFGVQLGYHFEGEANGVFLAGRIGTTKVKIPGDTTSPMNLGVVAGYDQMLGEYLSLGGEASFMTISESSPSEQFTILNFLASAKLWF